MSQNICDCGKPAVKDTGYCQTCLQRVNEQIEKEMDEEYFLLYENTYGQPCDDEELPFHPEDKT